VARSTDIGVLSIVGHNLNHRMESPNVKSINRIFSGIIPRVPRKWHVTTFWGPLSSENLRRNGRPGRPCPSPQPAWRSRRADCLRTGNF